MRETLLTIPLNQDASRKIIHIDMDAFYASIEERKQPAYVGKPLVIAHDPRKTGGKGVVTTANYTARQYGIHSAMAAAKALELCPKAQFKTPDFVLYRQVSEQIHEIFHQYTDKIEAVALDEAYLDVTENKLDQASAVAIARQLQMAVLKATSLTCSTGISYNKFLAKMASDYRKPFGLTVIRPEQARLFLAELPIEKFHGVGRKTVPKLQALGINKGRDLQASSELELMQHFGKMGFQLYRHAQGVDGRPVDYQRQRKSIGRETTFRRPLRSDEEVVPVLRELAAGVAAHLAKAQKHGKTVVLKMRDQDFNTTTKRLTVAEYVGSETQVYELAQELWQTYGQLQNGIRLLGITVTNLAPLSFEEIQLPLFRDDTPRES
jgi:DNA polymerase-4